MEKVKKIILKLIMNIVAIFISMLIIIPFVVVILNSFKTKGEANSMSLSLPKQWMVENYTMAIEQGKLVSSFLNSFMYAFLSCIIIVILVSAAAFVIARNNQGFLRITYYVIIAGIAIPLNNVTIMKVLQHLNLINTRVGIILLYAAINIPFSLFIAYGFINTIPTEIDEAAFIDGCKPGQLFIRIILPLLKPIISTLFVLNFMNVWNDFTMALYFLNNSKQWPMTLAVYNFFGMYENSWNLVSADVVLTLLPVIIIFILGQKYIVGGISAGAVKG